MLNEVGFGDWMCCEGFEYYGIELLFDGQCYCIDLFELIGGCVIIVYSQYEVVCDLIVVGVEYGYQMYFEVGDVVLYDVESEWLFVMFKYVDGCVDCIDCDYIVGCDGFYGIVWQMILVDWLNMFECVYLFVWFGIFVDVVLLFDEFVYVYYDNGFVLFLMCLLMVMWLYL